MTGTAVAAASAALLTCCSHVCVEQMLIWTMEERPKTIPPVAIDSCFGVAACVGVIGYVLGNVLTFSALSFHDRSRYPNRQSRWLLLAMVGTLAVCILLGATSFRWMDRFYGSLPENPGAVWRRQDVAATPEGETRLNSTELTIAKDEQSAVSVPAPEFHDDKDATARYSLSAGPELAIWSGFALFLAQVLHLVALLPHRDRLLVVSHSGSTKWLGRVAIISLLMYGAVSVWAMSTAATFPYQLRAEMMSESPHPSDLVRSTTHFVMYSSFGYGLLTLHLLVAIAFYLRYLWCFRQANQATIFLSYRRIDTGSTVRRIGDRVVEHFGSGALFRDELSIPHGCDFGEHIRNAMRQCQVVLAVIGTDWCNNPIVGQQDWVRLELEGAREVGVKVLPVLLDDASMPPSSQLAESIRWITEINAISIRQDADFDRDVLRMFEAVKSLLSK